MAIRFATLSAAEKVRFSEIEKSCPVRCKYLRLSITSLADYVAAVGGVISSADTFWFRGHEESQWGLTPAALRPKTITARQTALSLISDFKRIAEAKLPRLPDPDDDFKWAQVAQHYGLPTRLLDWTESATTALYFACLKPESDGIVFMMKPAELNSLGKPREARVLDPQTDRELILRFLRWGPREGKKNAHPVAVNPVWGSERIIVQRGTFTLHGSTFSLDNAKVSSLVALPVLREWKPRLRQELRRLGVDEMTLFPELEHACRHLKMCQGLMEFD
jgi:FRG domain-containing protein